MRAASRPSLNIPFQPMPCRLTALLLPALLLASGCSREPDASAKPRVALIMKSLANEFFLAMAKGAETHHAEHSDRYELLVNGIKNETDLAEQVGLVEQMTARGVSAIVIAPADSKALVPALKRAADQGVLIVNIDNKLDDETLAQSGLTAPFVGPDNRAGARSVGMALAAKLTAGDAVAIIEGVPTAFNGRQRRAGFEDAMAEAGMRVVSVQAGYWEMEKASAIAGAMLSEHAGLKAILCANDNMALGAAAAVQNAGRQDDVLIAGFDNINAIRPLIDDGRVVATADQHAADLAVFGIEAALNILSGEAPPEDQTTKVDLVTGR
jgi:ribose transport system substrate-binding protein